MELSVIKKTIKYLRIYLLLFKFGFILSTTYRLSFIVEILVELGYQVAFIFFFIVVLKNVQLIAGWSYYEILFFAGINIVASELILGSLFIFNLWNLPEKIKNGDIDTVLLKPINSMFYLSLGLPYFTSFVASFPGLVLIFYSLLNLHVNLSLTKFIISFFIFICGLIIAYSISIIFSSFSFKYISTSTFPRIAEKLIIGFKDKPHQVYQGFLKILFFFIFPVVFIASMPAYAALKDLEIKYLFMAFALSLVFFYIAYRLWNVMIKNYSSASS